MFTISSYILTVLLLLAGISAGLWAGNRFPDENKIRPRVYLIVSLGTALLISILVVIGVLHF